LDLRDVTVRAGDGVRGEVPGRLGGEQVRLERLAGPGVPDGERGDHVPGVDDPAGHTRLEREGDSGDVAPGNGDTAGTAQFLALTLTGLGADELRQSVRPGPGVRTAVELLPILRIDEPVVRAAIEHQRLRSRGLERGGDLCGGAV